MPVPMYVSVPAGRPVGGVVVFHEVFGVTGYIEDVCRRFAAEGYASVAPHLFHRSGDPAADYATPLPEMVPHYTAMTADGMLEDLDASLARLAEAGIRPAQTSLLGFCMGGSVVTFLAARRAVRAAVSFYGGGLTESRWPGVPALLEVAGELRTPWLGLFGDEDHTIPVEQVERMRAAAAASPVPTEVIRYPGAGHAFACEARPEHYHGPSARAGFAAARDWIRTGGDPARNG